MRIFSEGLTDDVAALLRGGKIGVIRTDTLYGVVGLADNQQAVERIYRAKQRDTSKPLITLVSDMNQLFDPPPQEMLDALNSLWPGKVSVILPARQAPDWIHRGSQTIAYRLPKHNALRDFIEKTGALVAPSANLEGQPPATTIDKAIIYFGETVDFYVDGGVVENTAPSQLVRIHENGEIERLR